MKRNTAKTVPVQRAMQMAIVVVACGLATTVSADTILSPWFTVIERRATQGANTPGSFAAAAMMGQQGWKNITPSSPTWESDTITSCQNKTKALPLNQQNLVSGLSLWPPGNGTTVAGCNPIGMAQALNAVDPLNIDWIKRNYPGTDGSLTDPGRVSIMSDILSAFTQYRSPVIIPLYGQADHWGTIVQINLWDVAGTGHQIGDIRTIKFFDGGPPTDTTGLADSSDNQYYPAGLIPESYGPSGFASQFFKMLTAINASCDPNCNSDPFYHNYVMMFEPPGGYVPPSRTAVLSDSPGIVPAHQHLMTEQLAQSHLLDALVAAGIDSDLDTWNAITGGVPGAALEVHAVTPSGAPWDYFLIPILSSPHVAIGFVQLSADDGSFQGIRPLATPVSFTPVGMAKATVLAHGLLMTGERLGKGMLTWDARTVTGFAKSPMNPYYEFSVTTAADPSKIVGMIRVRLNGGAVARRP